MYLFSVEPALNKAIYVRTIGVELYCYQRVNNSLVPLRLNVQFIVLSVRFDLGVHKTKIA